jgi:cell division protein FtsQ
MIVRRSPETIGERTPRRIVRRQGVVPAGSLARTAAASIGHSRGAARGLAWVVVAAMFVGLTTYGGYWLWESPAFRVNHVTVVGNQRVASDEIVGAVGLFDQSMFTANLADAQETLYTFPLLASVEVKRDWPNGIRVIVEERQAWGTWLQGGVRYTIDHDGVVLGTEAPPAGAPQIKAAETATLRVGDHVDYQAVAAAAEIYEKLPRVLGTTVTEIAYVTGSGVQVTTAAGHTGLLGDSTSIAYKLSAWAALATEARAKGINYTTIDLRYGNRPVLH